MRLMKTRLVLRVLGGSDLANQLATKVVELNKEYKARLETAGRTWKIYAKSIKHVGNMYGISWGIHIF